ncbi:hypothetical protein A7J58_06230 [Enterobacter cloacae]|nr:hypothetical protein A7J56_06215 [Enterobacter cloacae]OAE67615.1 hypothetical protein A7J58_06230 [Enterobacter cloacae]
MTLTQSQLIAYGFAIDERTPYGLTRKGKAVGRMRDGRPFCYIPGNRQADVRSIIWALANGDIPAGHVVRAVAGKTGTRAADLVLLTEAEAKARLSAVKSENAKKQNRDNSLPTGITKGKGGYYVASYMKQGIRFHKGGRDISELTVWLLRERDGLNIGEGV